MTKDKILRNFIESMERERGALRLTQAQMAKQLNMSVSKYKKLIAGETARVDLYTAYRLHQLTGKWILEICCCTHSDLMRTAYKLRKLTPSQLRFVASIIDIEIEFHDHLSSEAEEDYVDLLTFTGNLEDGMFWDSVYIEKLNIAPYRRRFGARLQCAIKVNSGHLRPVYHSGDILLLSQTAPRDGDIVVFINKDEGRVYIRKFHQTNPCILEPLNGYGISLKISLHKPEEVNKWAYFGCVLSKTRM